MTGKKPNIFVGIGLIIIFAARTIEQYWALPHLISGILMGLGLGLELLGAFICCRVPSRLRDAKRAFFRKILNPSKVSE